MERRPSLFLPRYFLRLNINVIFALKFIKLLMLCNEIEIAHKEFYDCFDHQNKCNYCGKKLFNDIFK